MIIMSRFAVVFVRLCLGRQRKFTANLKSPFLVWARSQRDTPAPSDHRVSPSGPRPWTGTIRYTGIGVLAWGLWVSRNPACKSAHYAFQNLAAVFDYWLRIIPRYRCSADGASSLSVLGYENKSSRTQVVTIWCDDTIPSDNDKEMRIDFTFSNGRFADISCYDSPLLIADKSIS